MRIKTVHFQDVDGEDCVHQIIVNTMENPPQGQYDPVHVLGRDFSCRVLESVPVDEGFDVTYEVE